MTSNELEFIKDKNLFNDCLEDIFLESDCNHESELINLHFENKLNVYTEKLLRERLKNCSSCLRLYMDLEYSYLETDNSKEEMLVKDKEVEKAEDNKVIDFELKRKSKNSNVKFFSGALLGSVAATIIVVLLLPNNKIFINSNENTNFISTSANIDSEVLNNYNNIKSEKNTDLKIGQLKEFIGKYPDFLPAIFELALLYKNTNNLDNSKKYFSMYIEKALKNKTDLEMDINNAKKYLEE